MWISFGDSWYGWYVKFQSVVIHNWLSTIGGEPHETKSYKRQRPCHITTGDIGSPVGWCSACHSGQSTCILVTLGVGHRTRLDPGLPMTHENGRGGPWVAKWVLMYLFISPWASVVVTCIMGIPLGGGCVKMISFGGYVLREQWMCAI